ncbi:Restriction endonuclease S subunits-like protein [Janibacter hoylei PVAS-1]|uniref:Restriction endonuclease S subunits-like protein n=1 Tax=Janibacter hoylei PVAS-1 TaxID=1210046 RepID=K1E3F2_9MICO|nr:restriction endonuclease subunit S [Janibacter hoylei]EKA61546.1 Restriction endonuclease S subunits-like protein [Janibacter hoylei PVAS-1]RWU84280.1 restriction endonuclease subunit S [Janibacter hoylei PVAS-1]
MKRVPLLEAVSDVSGGNRKILQSDFLPEGPLAVVDQGRSQIAGYTYDTSASVKADGPVIVFGDHTRAIKFVDFPFAMGADGVKVLQVREGFDPKFVYHYLISRELPSAGYSRHFKFLKQVEVPRPRIEEQRRIAAILDHANALRAKRRRVLAHLDDLTQSIFHDMFGDPDDFTDQVPFSEIATLAGGRNLVADDDAAASEYRVLKISSVTTGRFKPSEAKALPPEYVPPAEHMVRVGDLLMSRANTTELVGAVALVDSDPTGLVLPDKIWRFVWGDPESEPAFFHALLSTPSMRRRISRLSSGTGGSMKNISKSKLGLMSVPRITPTSQREFVAASQTLSAVRRRQSRTAGVGDELFASLQARAFTGDL